MAQTVEILLPNHLGHGFDYAVPEEMEVQVGDYVDVPFGNRRLPGVVWTLREETSAVSKTTKSMGGEDSSPSEPSARGAVPHASDSTSRSGGDKKSKSFTLKPLETYYEHLPPLSNTMQRFVEWVAWYTSSPLGGILKMVMPVSDALKPPNNRERSNLPATRVAPKVPKLSAEQQVAADDLTARLEKGFSCALLDGVTGSGKTEVYFEAIEAAIRDGGQALVLLPEISLSVQWLERFQERFGFAPVAWHSGLPPGLRKHSWRAIVRGEAKVIVGARSALFLPYMDLRLIVVDEEHDSSYKQEEGIIYHARDMAVVRASLEKIPAVLVSATPSLETYYNVLAGKYDRLVLPERHGAAKMPALEMIDMRNAPLDRGNFIAGPLRAALAQTLANGNQSLLFLNRRGYAPLVLCRACGHRFQCPQCSAWLVLHDKYKSKKEKNTPQAGGASLELVSLHEQEASAGDKPYTGKLSCHHCGFGLPLPDNCPECEAEDSMHACGPGVERVAEEVANFLPDARLGVMTSDHTENYNSLQELIHQMLSGQIDILIGTQMVAKGHHFANLALVGVVDADLGLSGGDLRAAERTYQLLHQISGRAGRAEVEGRVMLQSFSPDHPVMKALMSGDRESFYSEELHEREACRMPPYAKLVAVIVESQFEDRALAEARKLASTAPRHDGIQILGPAPAPLYMLRGKYRQRLLVRAKREIDIQAWLHGWIGPEARKHKAYRIKIDIDPVSFL